MDWVTLSNSETFCVVNEESCLKEALAKVDSTIVFSDFDEDQDGIVDAVAFMHSGYGAENGLDPNTHIWAQTTKFAESLTVDGVMISQYMITSSLWGETGTEISRIGVFSHELGQL